MNKTVIYALKEPTENGEIRYIGQTRIGVAKRLYSHMSHCDREHTHKNHWLLSLKTQGLRPHWDIIEVFDDAIDQKTLDDREIYWIAYYRELLPNLTNTTNGGSGTLGCYEKHSSMTEEERKAYYQSEDRSNKLRIAAKKMYAENTGIREKQRMSKLKPVISFNYKTKETIEYSGISETPFQNSGIYNAMKKQQPYKDCFWFYFSENKDQMEIDVIVKNWLNRSGRTAASNNTKLCSQCKRLLSFESFYSSTDTKLGLSSKCKKCDSDRKTSYILRKK